MTMKIGLSNNKPYIFNNMVLPTNTEIANMLPVKSFDKEYRDDDMILDIKLPFLSDPMLSNEDYTKKIIDLVKADKITSIKNVIDEMLLSLDYTLTDDRGNTIGSAINISNIQLSNVVLLTTGKVGDSLSYRSIKKITSKAVIGIIRPKGFGITFDPFARTGLPKTFIINGLNLFAEIYTGNGTFDVETEKKYREKVFNFISTNYSSNEAVYKAFINKYFPEDVSAGTSEDYNRFWSCKDDYIYKTQYLLDKEVLGKNGVDIINNDMLKTISPTPIVFEIKDVKSIIVNLELYIESGDIIDSTELENAIIENKAIADNISFEPVVIVTDPPSDAIVTPVDTTTNP